MEELETVLIAHRWGSEEAGQPWLGFDATGRLFGSDGCNRLMGQWTVIEAGDGTQGGVMEFARLVSTMMFCHGVDTWLLRAASARLLQDRLGDRLEIHDPAGEVIGTLARYQPRSTA